MYHSWIRGIRLVDSKGKHIVNQTWCTDAIQDEHSKWLILDIDASKEIIGLKCNNTSQDYITRLGFLLWTPSKID